MPDLPHPRPLFLPDGRLDAAIARTADNAGPADRGESDLAPDLDALQAAGLMAAPLPRRHGGAGLATSGEATGRAVSVLRTVGRASLSVARLYEGHVNAIRLVDLYGGEKVRRRTFEAVRAGSRLAVWGADGDRPVTVEDEGGHLALSGAKRFASGLGLVDQAVVTARDGEGVRLVIVDVRDEARADPACWTASGMRATRSGTYTFDGVSVPREALLGAPGDVFREPFFEGGVWRYCAAHTGGAESLFCAMRQHLLERGRAEDPHQLARIAAAASACETARLRVEAAAARVEAGPRESEAEREGAAACALLARDATEAACLAVIDTAERAVGAAAFMEGEPIERIRRDLGLFLRQAAPDAKRARAARALLAGGGLAEDL